MINKGEFYDEIIESQKIGHFTERAVASLNEMSERIIDIYNVPVVGKEISAEMIVTSQRQLTHFNPKITGKKETAYLYFQQVLRSYFAGKGLKIKKETMKKTEKV